VVQEAHAVDLVVSQVLRDRCRYQPRRVRERNVRVGPTGLDGGSREVRPLCQRAQAALVVREVDVRVVRRQQQASLLAQRLAVAVEVPASLAEVVWHRVVVFLAVVLGGGGGV
jgi:hypothetical protein